MKTCLYCGGTDEDASTICRHCGKDFPAQPDVQQVPVETGPEAHWATTTVKWGCGPVLLLLALLILLSNFF